MSQIEQQVVSFEMCNNVFRILTTLISIFLANIVYSAPGRHERCSEVPCTISKEIVR